VTISVVGTPGITQQTSNITPAFGAGWQAGDLHIIWQRVKGTTSDVAGTPTGYTDLDSEVVSGPHTMMRLSARILQSGDTAPVISPPGGVQLMVGTITLRGTRNDSVANALEAAGHTSNSSSTALNYSAATITTNGCMALVFGTYPSTGAGTLGTPTTLSGSAVNQIAAATYLNMKAALWSDLQTTAANISAGNIPITSGSVQTNRGQILVIRPAVATQAITAVSDGLVYDTETSVAITCSGAGATKGAGFVKISPTNNIADASAVTQTTTSWSDTAIQFTANLTSFPYFTNLYVFFQNNSGSANASGFVIQREARFKINDDFDNGGSPWASQSNIVWSARASSIRGTELMGGTTETTDGSAILDTPYYTLTSGGAVAPGDHVWLTFAQDNATLANTRATALKYLPTYV
jgi:hypothetical protein